MSLYICSIFPSKGHNALVVPLITPWLLLMCPFSYKVHTHRFITHHNIVSTSDNLPHTTNSLFILCLPSLFLFSPEGHDALIVSSEDDRYVVVAGTFEKLVEQLACEEKPDPRFVMTFLLGYRHFSTSTELLTILLRRYPSQLQL